MCLLCVCVFEQVKEQQTFLDESLSMWGKFQSQCGVFEDWLSRAEELVTRDSYGYTLKETEAYCSNIKVGSTSVYSIYRSTNSTEKKQNIST